MELPAAGRTAPRMPFAVLIALSVVLSACASDVPPWDDSQSRPPDGPAILTAKEARDARRTAARFLDAFIDWDTDALWDTLVPEAQGRWGEEEAFERFLERKFPSRDLAYEIGEPHSLDGRRTINLPLTIDFEDSSDRLIGPPLVLAERDGDIRVADAGPLGARGPVIGSPPAVRPELDVPVLIYHHVAPELPADPRTRADTVTTAAFASQLNWLADNQYATITVAELFNAFYYDIPLPLRPVILIFDDGYMDVYVHAFTMLRERGLVATIAAISGLLNEPGYLTWEQLREMAASGVEIVSHTVSHANLAALPLAATQIELAESRRVLEEGLGRPVQFFVYPYGEPFVRGSAEAREMVLALLRETGYAGAFTTSSGPPYVSLQKAEAPYQLRRIPVSGGETLERFVASITATPTPTPSPKP